MTPSYTWTLPGATTPTITTNDPGPAFDGHAPGADGAPEYVTATWATTGARTVTLTVTWTVAFHRDDTGRTLRVDPAIVTRGDATADVRQSRAVLTGNS